MIKMKSKAQSSLNEYERFRTQQDIYYSENKISTIMRLKNSYITDESGYTDSVENIFQIDSNYSRLNYLRPFITQ